MQRDFCLNCGLPLDDRPCSCNLDREREQQLERQEAEHLAEFNRARPLTMRDMGERVRTADGPVLTVSELLASLSHPGAIRELGVRRTERELLQVVYEKERGSRLYRWPLE